MIWRVGEVTIADARSNPNLFFPCFQNGAMGLSPEISTAGVGAFGGINFRSVVLGSAWKDCYIVLRRGNLEY